MAFFPPARLIKMKFAIYILHLQRHPAWRKAPPEDVASIIAHVDLQRKVADGAFFLADRKNAIFFFAFFIYRSSQQNPFPFAP
ncbi:MAG: hypothetical protein E7320_09805 [Clostridiales bacterium]|nr:hypothetical protein [Clostridiales bacterium]